VLAVRHIYTVPQVESEVTADVASPREERERKRLHPLGSFEYPGPWVPSGGRISIVPDRRGLR
jgi:hypothetical protein